MRLHPLHLLPQIRKRRPDMSLKSEIQAGYIDKNGLVSPHALTPLGASYTASGNGLCYTGEYYCLLAETKTLEIQDRIDFQDKVRAQCSVQGRLQRSAGDTTEEGPDDYYGVAAGCSATGNCLLANDILSYGLRHFGSYSMSGKWSWTSFLWRQPQLFFALNCAARIRHPLLWPFAAYSALVIATSCMFAKPLQQDSWRLNWLLIQATAPVSLLCRLASKIWLRRLHKRYGNPGMANATAGYYEAGHPIPKFMVD
jgi:hypothetical protein